jgi:hypothetical protein
MAITTYSELRAKIGEWQAREDLLGNAAEFIQLAEARLNRKLLTVRANHNNGNPFQLSDAEPTNWLLANAPDVYLAASLIWGGVFVKNDEEAGRWNAVLQTGLDDLLWADDSANREVTLQVDPALWPCNSYFDITTGE